MTASLRRGQIAGFLIFLPVKASPLTMALEYFLSNNRIPSVVAKVAHIGYGGTQCLSRTDPAQAVGGDSWVSLRYGPPSQPYPRARNTQAMAMWLSDLKCAVLLVNE